MWFLIYITLANASVSQYQIANIYRLNLGGILLGIWEFSLGFGVLLAMMLGGRYNARNPKARTHPAMIWILALLSLGFLAGVVGALLNNSPLKYALASGREYAAAPICIYAAYRLFPATQSAMKLIYALILGGTVTAIFLVLNFGENAEMAGFRDNINLVRSVNFVSSYAGLACLILVYTMTDRRFKVLPTPVAATVAAFCLVGQFATLH
ncbi:MAG: hypothetical protein ACREJC_04795, partial [Tepidisphaeraceae bacterium]